MSATDPSDGHRPFRRGTTLLGLLAVALLAAACSGGNAFRADTSTFAQRFLPTERSVDYPPDSLALVSIRETEDHLTFDLEEDYAGMMEQWSTRPRDVSANRSPLRSYSYATLWSRELSIVSLEPEAAVTSLSKDQARKLIDQRQDEYEKSLQIDVYWFGSPERTIIAGPSARVRLMTSEDSTYRPTRWDYGPVREAFVDGGGTALYRRNTFFFKRAPDGDDFLDRTRNLTLSIRPLNSSRDYRFRWSWKEGTPARAAAQDQSR